jgi:hypothetical protein
MKLPVLATGPLLLLAACGSTGIGPAGVEPMTNEDVFVFYCAGADAMFGDERDAALEEALSLLDDRLLELPEELGEGDFPAPMVELVLDMLASPMSLRVDLEDDIDWSDGPPVHAQLTLEGEPEMVSSIASRFHAYLGMAVPLAQDAVPGEEKLRSSVTPAGTTYFGETDGRFVVSLGEPKRDELGLGSLDLPRGVEPEFALKMDLTKVMPPLMAYLAMSGDAMGPLAAQLSLMGLSAETPLSFTMATGHGTDRAYFASRTKNYAQLLEAQGQQPLEPLTQADLEAIPSDATYASLVKFDWGYMLQMLDRLQEQMGEEDVPNLRAMAKQLVGIDLEEDLFGPLGTTTGMYMSDTTGGGGLLSTVLFASVDDEERLRETIDRLVGIANGLAADAVQGYVTIRHWEHEEAPCWTLSFPGLPIPMQLSAALTDGYFIEAVTPQALTAAVDQVRGEGRSLLDNRAFRTGAGSTKDLYSVSYQDTERLIDDGYGLATLLFSTLSNGVRSREEDRGPDFVLPPFNELKEGAVPQVIVGRMDGDDLVGSGQMDASLTANVTAMLGTPLFKIMVLAGAAGGFAGVTARQEAAETEALLRMIEGDQAAADAWPEMEIEVHDEHDHEHGEGHDHDHDHDHDR